MYERMLNKKAAPAIEEMTEYCGENGERFSFKEQHIPGQGPPLLRQSLFFQQSHNFTISFAENPG